MSLFIQAERVAGSSLRGSFSSSTYASSIVLVEQLDSSVEQFSDDHLRLWLGKNFFPC